MFARGNHTDTGPASCLMEFHQRILALRAASPPERLVVGQGRCWWVGGFAEEPVYAEVMRVAQETLDAELSGRGYGRSSAPIGPPAG